jgi:DNA replication and repair protein RecF
LLLDDIFDKLDDHRVRKLMELVSHRNFGQIFITDTHPERIQSIFRDISVPVKTFTIRTANVIA